MSLPSIDLVAKELGIDLKGKVSRKQQEKVLVEAMGRDLRPALDFLHSKAHEAQINEGFAQWSEDPNSPMGKMLVRIHAGDALRKLASKHFCHGLRLSFANCCNGTVGKAPKEPLKFQIECQTGPIAYADC